MKVLIVLALFAVAYGSELAKSADQVMQPAGVAGGFMQPGGFGAGAFGDNRFNPYAQYNPYGQFNNPYGQYNPYNPFAQQFNPLNPYAQYNPYGQYNPLAQQLNPLNPFAQQFNPYAVQGAGMNPFAAMNPAPGMPFTGFDAGAGRPAAGVRMK